METGILHTGTVICGTYRMQDLLPALLDTVGAECPTEYEQLMALPFGFIPNYALEDEDAEFWSSEDAVFKLDELIVLLGKHAAQFDHYFGAHPGDGSDFGFWPADIQD